ncbi:MAG: class IV adenylate cyclase [Phycisphaerae bacterium]|jgi:predicted adenylyl cyclase CyaB|nr:class IV adenylate cyclase [Phycisphaerae bacterium]MDP7636508.1 class IV adenylate cyclase [Phycisphaerae bacterium]
MADEIEAKYKVDTFAAVRRAMGRAGATYLGTVLQTDLYYDTSGRDLLHGDSGLRIRLTRRLRRGRGAAKGLSDTRPLLTYKGPVCPRSRVKVRKEIQTRFDDDRALGDILAALGLELTLKIQKRRARYRLGRCRVELDELPILGRFVEIEAAAARGVASAARKLGLTDEPICDHYVNLALDACRRLGRKGPRREITFNHSDTKSSHRPAR